MARFIIVVPGIFDKIFHNVTAVLLDFRVWLSRTFECFFKENEV